MSEYMEGGSRFERINNNAFWANAHLDTRLQLDKNNIDENYNHIKDCIDNPTTGLIAGRKYRTLNYPMHYARNQRDLFECSKMRQVNNEFVKIVALITDEFGTLKNIVYTAKRYNLLTGCTLFWFI